MNAQRQPLHAAWLPSLLMALAACQSAPPAAEPVTDALYTRIERTAEGTRSVEGVSRDESAGPADLGFIAGRWVGEAFGGTVEENWNPLLGGQMLGTFRLVMDGEPMFSEHMLIAELDGQPVLRLKHFEANLVGWEEKDDHVQFELIAVEPGRAAYFDGLTFLRDGDSLEVLLAMVTEEGARIEEFKFLRAPR